MKNNVNKINYDIDNTNPNYRYLIFLIHNI